jgi:PTS system nitrogen regulatory IIA component
MSSQRERLGTTRIGGASPCHSKLAEIRAVRTVCELTSRWFEAIDDQPVDLVFLLLAPEGAGADHLKALARVSRLLRDKSVCEKLRGADQADALYALLTDSQRSHAA